MNSPIGVAWRQRWRRPCPSRLPRKHRPRCRRRTGSKRHSSLNCVPDERHHAVMQRRSGTLPAAVFRVQSLERSRVSSAPLRAVLRCARDTQELNAIESSDHFIFDYPTPAMTKTLKTAPELERYILNELRSCSACNSISAVTVSETTRPDSNWQVSHINAI